VDESLVAVLRPTHAFTHDDSRFLNLFGSGDSPPSRPNSTSRFDDESMVYPMKNINTSICSWMMFKVEFLGRYRALVYKGTIAAQRLSSLSLTYQLFYLLFFFFSFFFLF
jgi:hypothetical protein